MTTDLIQRLRYCIKDFDGSQMKDDAEPRTHNCGLLRKSADALEGLMAEKEQPQSPLEKIKLALDAKVVIEHYDRIVDGIHPSLLAQAGIEADFVITVADYHTLRNVIAAIRNIPAEPNAAQIAQDWTEDAATLLLVLRGTGEARIR